MCDLPTVGGGSHGSSCPGVARAWELGEERDPGTGDAGATCRQSRGRRWVAHATQPLGSGGVARARLSGGERG
ncbi:hypothetical protein AXF42_Ash003540 [Apostasia shenzhenica]|uniref:Uncharacterized protein n=1 Tax=Apostasia shenzhenica TaxID=1088818 RepID=A0A2I0BGF1_9ASPA|nr:hypothetical protein AXF42_Ash003540 [Apostasia shenzhenica]